MILKAINVNNRLQQQVFRGLTYYPALNNLHYHCSYSSPSTILITYIIYYDAQ